MMAYPLQRKSAYLALSLVLLAGMLVSIGLGAVPLSPRQVIAVLMGTPAKASHAAIVWNFRVARVLLVGLSGAALGAAGAGFQGLFRNPLADPFIVGASGGAALGATLSVVLAGGPGRGIPISMAGFVGALLAVLLVYLLAESSGYGSVAALLLAGAALSAMLSSIVSLLLVLNDQALETVFLWLLGGFSGRSWGHLKQAALVAPPGMLLLWLMARPLDALAGGEESAQALGLNLRRARFVIIASASLATAASVAAGGIIGFIGLIAPHIARPLFGPSHARLVPAAMLIGALLLLLADDVARTAAAPLELPIGTLTALLGGPFFLYLLRKHRQDSW